MAYFEVNKKPRLTFPTLTGSIVTFNAQYALPLKSHTIALTATQSGSGTPSPDNVRPINGWSAINIANASEDLYNDITVENGYLDTGGNVRALGVSSVTDYIPVVEGLVYYYYDYATATLGPRNICIYDSSKQFVSYIGYQTVNKKVCFSIPSSGAYIRITIDRNYINQHLYNGTTTTIQIGSTVYGGEYDARTGVLTVTHGYLDLGSVNWDKYTNANKTYFRTTSEVADMKKSNNPNALQGLVCSIYPEATWSQAVDSAGYNEVICKGWSGRSYIAIADTNYDNYTTSDFKTAMSGVQLVYELETPTTIQLPPCPIDTLKGVNNIFADTGDTTLQYAKVG